MRALIAFSCLLAATACSGDSGADKAAAPAAPATVPAGQWQTGYEVTAIRSTDHSIPAIPAKVGDKGSFAACVGKADGQQPDPALFAGDGYQCSYKSSYIKDGMLNASLSCTRKKIPGEFLMDVKGSYTATGFDGTVETNTYLPGPGDFAMTRKLSGHLAGPACTPVAADAGAAVSGRSAGGKAGG
jgi:hypothetical protein